MCEVAKKWSGYSQTDRSGSSGPGFVSPSRVGLIVGIVIHHDIIWLLQVICIIGHTLLSYSSCNLQIKMYI